MTSSLTLFADLDVPVMILHEDQLTDGGVPDGVRTVYWPMPSVATIVAHVSHVADLIGADRVCLGSDHGAVRFDIPGFEDCTRFPVVTQALRDRGFSDQEVRNILGENVLRLMARVIGS